MHKTQYKDKGIRIQTNDCITMLTLVAVISYFQPWADLKEFYIYANHRRVQIWMCHTRLNDICTIRVVSHSCYPDMSWLLMLGGKRNGQEVRIFKRRPSFIDFPWKKSAGNTAVQRERSRSTRVKSQKIEMVIKRYWKNKITVWKSKLWQWQQNRVGQKMIFFLKQTKWVFFAQP